MVHYNLFIGKHDGEFSFIPYSERKKIYHEDYWFRSEYEPLTDVIDSFAEFASKHRDELSGDECFFIAYGNDEDPVALVPSAQSNNYGYLKEWTLYKGIYTPMEQHEYTVRDEVDDIVETIQAWSDEDAYLYFRSAYADINDELGEDEYYSLHDEDGKMVSASWEWINN